MPRKRKHMRRNRPRYSEPSRRPLPKLTFRREWLLQSLGWMAVLIYSQWRVHPERFTHIGSFDVETWRVFATGFVLISMCVVAGAFSTWLRRRRRDQKR